MASRKWPRYEVGHKDYIFALGVIAANFNELEGQLSEHFAMHVRLPWDAVDLLFAKLDNSLRIMLIRHCLSGHGAAQMMRRPGLPYNEKERDAIDHFMKGYAICAENRNILLHSQVDYGKWPDSRRRRVTFIKESKKPPYSLNQYVPSLKSLRAIADAMHAFSEYGSDLYWMLRDTYWMEEQLGLKNLRRPLPHKPPYQSLWLRSHLKALILPKTIDPGLNHFRRDL